MKKPNRLPTPEEIERIFKKAEKEQEAARRKEEAANAPGVFKTGSRCSCGGDIVLHREHRYDPSTGPMIFGPGSKNQIRKYESLYCDACGLKYQKLPKEKSHALQKRT